MTDQTAMTVRSQGISSNGELLQFVLQSTPEDLLKEREGRRNQKYTYVAGVDFIRRLNEAFGMKWSFEVRDVMRYGEEEFVVVHGRLSATLPSGDIVVKEQFGSSEIKYKQNGGLLDIGDDVKAAATDCLKKCASMLGVFLDTYGDGVEKPKLQHDRPADVKTLGLLNELGENAYGDEWETRREALVQWATDGLSGEYKDLNQSEAMLLVKGLQERSQNSKEGTSA